MVDPWEARKWHRLNPLRCYLTLRRFVEPYWYRATWASDPWRHFQNQTVFKCTVESDDEEAKSLLSLERIPSAVTSEQAKALFIFASLAPQTGDIVEIGSDRGKSTIALSWGAKRNLKPCLVHAVDPFPGGAMSSQFERVGILKNNLTEHNADNVILSVQSGGEYRRERSEPIRLLFVDAAHDYLNSCFDFMTWKPLVVPDGFIIAHDVDNYHWGPGTRKAFLDCILSDPDFRLSYHVDNMAVAQRITTLD